MKKTVHIAVASLVAIGAFAECMGKIICQQLLPWGEALKIPQEGGGQAGYGLGVTFVALLISVVAGCLISGALWLLIEIGNVLAKLWLQIFGRKEAKLNK